MEEKKTKQITLRLPEDLYGKLGEISNKTGINITCLLLISIWNSVLKPKMLLK